MKKLLSIILAVFMISSMLVTVYAEESKIEATFLYVATDGSDTNDGSITSPFATLKAAAEASKNIDGAVVINLREGSYKITETVKIECDNVVIRSFPGERAVLTGGDRLAFSDFKPVEGEDKERIIDKKAQDKVMVIDLKEKGITNYGEQFVAGYHYLNVPVAPELIVNGKRLSVSRYPNDDFLMTGRILQEGVKAEDEFFAKNIPYPTPDELSDDKVFKFVCNDSRTKKWTNAQDVWIMGYFKHDYADAKMGATIDAEAGTVTSKYPALLGVAENRRFYFFNLLEEIDVPGEWYLDRSTGKLYVYPTDDFNATAEIEYITFDDKFIDFSNAKNITIQSIDMCNGLGMGIAANPSDNSVVEDCEFYNLTQEAIWIVNSYNCIARNNYLHDLGGTAIKIGGGDKETLKPGNNRIENNKIHTFSQVVRTYTPAITTDLVGNTIAHNEIYDAPHQAITYGGNNHVIEYNEIYDVCQETSDSGAIYCCRRWNDRGHVIRYNYFHDLIMADIETSFKIQAVYLDDMHSSTEVYSNVFYNCYAAALIGGGRNNKFRNNLILDCVQSVEYDARGTTWFNCGTDSSIYKNLVASPYKTEAWAVYENLADMLEDEPEIPKYAVIENNAAYKTPDMNIDPLVKQYGTVEETVELVDTKYFADYRNKDFTVLENSEIYEKIPEWEAIPFKDIGTYDYETVDNYVDAAKTENADPNAIKVLLNGSAIKFDVAPQIINDRTMVPLRAIFEALGAEVSWDDATKTVTAVKDDVTIKMTIGADSFTRNGEAVSLDSPATIVDSRTLVPVRAIAESFGSEVGWIAETKTVTID